jgi:putative spermidine/putrescine transport system ATP-binding protein
MMSGALRNGETVDLPADSGSGTEVPALVARGLRKDYGRQTVVSGFDLEVAEGEFVTLLGSSGSGKTTTLMMVAGFVDPDDGEIDIAGQLMTHVAPQKRNIGMMFQSYALFPHMTVRDNIAFPLKRRRLSKDEIDRLVNGVLERVQLQGFEGRYPAQLSGGQQQRVALARATVYSPPLLLMDEPLSALDRNLRRSLQEELKRFHRELGTSILYVTHDQEEALSLSDRVLLMDQGQLAQAGTPQEIYERPESLFVARFLGESNSIAGTVVSCDGGEAAIKLSTGKVVGGTCPEPMVAGAPAVVVVRPEHLIVEWSETGAEGWVEMAVEETSYLGDKVRCRGRFATDEPCVLMVEPDHASDLWPGAVRQVRWEPSRAVVLPPENSQT